MSTNGYRPASHPVLQRIRLPVDDLDDLHVSRGSIIDQLREERDPALPGSGNERVIDGLAAYTVNICPPFNAGQRRQLAVIAAALQRLAEGGAL